MDGKLIKRKSENEFQHYEPCLSMSFQEEIAKKFFNLSKIGTIFYSAWKYFVNLFPGAKILIIERRLGMNVFSIAEMGLEPVSIVNDCSESVFISELAKDAGFKLDTCIVQNLEEVPFLDNSFDLVVVSDIFEVAKTIPYNIARQFSIKMFIDRVVRLLKPNGTIYISSKNFSLRTLYNSHELALRSYFIKWFLRRSGLEIENILEFAPSGGSLVTSCTVRRNDDVLKGIKRSIKRLKNVEEVGYICRRDGKSRENHSILRHVEDSIIKKKIPGEISFKRLTAGSGSTIVVDLEDYIVRFPSPRFQRSINRWQRNYDALLSLKNIELPFDVPDPILVDEILGQPYSVESKLKGIEIDIRGKSKRQLSGEIIWDEAVRGLKGLFLKTVTYSTFNEEHFNNLILGPLNLLTPYLSEKDKDRIIKIQYLMEAVFLNKSIPLVHTHGDFKFGNVKFGKNGCLTGVFDWDLSVTMGLPLMDLFSFIGFEEANRSGVSFQNVILKEFIQSSPVNNKMVHEYFRDTEEIDNIQSQCIALMSIIHFFCYQMGGAWCDKKSNKIEIKRVLSAGPDYILK
jgi:hypothetical protein